MPPATATDSLHLGNLLGAGSGLQWDFETDVTVNLPYTVDVTPHYDGAPSEFTYNGAHYQDGWNHQQIDDNSWYDSIGFGC